MASNLSVVRAELKTIKESAAALSAAITSYTTAVDAQVDKQYGAQSATGKTMGQVTGELALLGLAINVFISGFAEKDGEDMSASEVIDTVIRSSAIEAGPALATQAQKEMIELIQPFQSMAQALLQVEPRPDDIPTGPIITIPRPTIPIIPDFPIVVGPNPRPRPGPDPAPPFDLGGAVEKA